MPKLIKIYGERNTNTKYLSQLIRLNIRAKELPGVVPYSINKMQKFLPGNEWLKDAYFLFTYRRNLGWKHTRVKPMSELRKYGLVKNDDLVILTITKNPYAWLLSLYRNPYHQYRPRMSSFETFLSSTWKTVGRDNTKKILKNPIELWNIKNSAYLDLPSTIAVNLTSEDILVNPSKIVDRVSRQFSIGKLSDGFFDCDRSTSEADKNKQYYLDYYLNERWRDEMSQDAIEIINGTVNRDIMVRFGYKMQT